MAKAATKASTLDSPSDIYAVIIVASTAGGVAIDTSLRFRERSRAATAAQDLTSPGIVAKVINMGAPVR